MTEHTQFIIDSLKAHYAIDVATLILLPVGADVNAAVYRVEDQDNTYFVKVKRDFHDEDMAIVEALVAAGVYRIIAPVKTLAGASAYRGSGVTFIVYPFVDGQDGFCRRLHDEQWIELGRTLRQVHEIRVPVELRARIRVEKFAKAFCDEVRALYRDMDEISIHDEVARVMRNYLLEKRDVVMRLVDGADDLRRKIASRTLSFVLCHGDLHGGNVLISDDRSFYIVDWDAPIMAPRERDLMFVGGGIGNVWNDPREEKLFYRGYGDVEVDATVLAYYRYERIVEDIAEYGRELLLKTAGDKREEMYQHFLSMFAPNGVVDIANVSYTELRNE